MMRFYVKTLATCRRHGIAFIDYLPENTQPIGVYGRSRHHDGRFRLAVPGVLDFGFIAEVDNHTETMVSAGVSGKTITDWMRTYLHYDKRTKKKEQVLIVSTRGGRRLGNLMALAARLNPNPDRNLFLGVDLPAYLEADDPLTGLYCRDQNNRPVPLLWYPDRRLRLLAALRKRPLTVKEILRHSRISARPYTSPATIKNDLRFLYRHGLLQFQHWLCAGRPVFEFQPTPTGATLIQL